MISKILHTILIIFIYRLCLQIPAPGAPDNIITDMPETSSKLSLLGFLSKISGAKTGSIFVLGISPYIMTSILVQLIFLTFDSLKKYKEQNPMMINQITRILSIFFAFIQLRYMNTSWPFESDIDKYIFVLSIVTGSIIAMWLSEKISEQKIGNGTSIIIFSITVALIPQNFLSLFNKLETGIISSPTVIIEIASFICVLIIVIFAESAVRKIYVLHSSQQNKYSQDNFIPLKLNPSGILPIIFTKMFVTVIISSFIAYISETFSVLSFLPYYLSPNQPYYIIFEIIVLTYMTYAFTSVIFEGKVIAENLQKQNTYIRGIKPGKNTENYFNLVINNINIVSIIYISTIVILLPSLLINNLMNETAFQGISMLIMVSVVIDTFSHIQNNQMNIKYNSVKQKIKFIR